MAIMHRELLNIYDSWQFHLRSVPFLCNADEHADHVCQDACSKATHQMRHNRETGELGALQVIEHRNVVERKPLQQKQIAVSTAMSLAPSSPP